MRLQALLGSTVLVAGILGGCSSGDGEGGTPPLDADTAARAADAGPVDARLEDGGDFAGDGSVPVGDAPLAGDAAVANDAAPGPRPPVASAVAISVEVEGTVEGKLAGTDPNGDPLTFSLVGAPGKGTVSKLDPATGTFSYTTTATAPGTDSFQFQVSDGTSQAAVPGVVSVTITAFNFTGAYALTGAMVGARTCNNTTFTIQQHDGTLTISERRMVCGSTTITYNSLGPFTIDGGTLELNGSNVGRISSAEIFVEQSRFVSGCGTVRARFSLMRTATGFTYSDEASASCTGAQNATATVTYTPTARLLFDKGFYTLPSVQVGETTEGILTVQNIGKVAATKLAPGMLRAPLGFAGGTYPGRSGTCGSTLPAFGRCTMVVGATSSEVTRYDGGLVLSFSNGLADTSVGTSITFTVTPLLAQPRVIAVGELFACVLDAGGVKCWGASSSGVLTVPPLENPTRLVAGHSHACVIHAAGVRCWGALTAVPPLVNPRAISSGNSHACAIDDTGVVCWGANDRGQASPPPLTNPTAVEGGGNHTCALHQPGVTCWGLNTSGQTTVPPLVTPRAIATGSRHSCALDDNGVRCWGGNEAGQSTPPALTNVQAIEAGERHSCALTATGVRCWGDGGKAATAVPSLTAPTSLSIGTFDTCVLDAGRAVCW